MSGRALEMGGRARAIAETGSDSGSRRGLPPLDRTPVRAVGISPAHISAVFRTFEKGSKG
jgi:hypothetical protein